METDAAARMTLQSIADRLGISRTTVSNAYNRPEHLSAELLAKVLTTAAELGYAGPNPVASKLRTGKNSAIGLVTTDSLPYAFFDEAAASFLQGVALACEQAATSLLLMPLIEGNAKSLNQINLAAVDAVICYSMSDSHPALKAVLQRKIPVVVVDGPKTLEDTEWVGLDQLAASAETARYIAGLGHREVGVLCHRLADETYVGHVDSVRLAKATYPVQRERVRGFLEEFVSVTDGRGIVRVSEQIVSDIESGRAGAEAILRDYPEVTAIVCTCDALAKGVLVAAARRGLSVPGGLSVTGFDDIPSAAAAGLTTVWQPMVEKGQVAAEMLLGHPRVGAPRHHYLPTRLVVRNTTGPPTTR
ncbi:MAG: LacI family DNA-binding transcriptional regulator [Propionibacteriaceae bacterium]|jgi:DNA-binding LacI/PurR family transcriptional regulator|nr:LacI family DNA-binding transcriptional regulator [Propionibacteriaceae bacterium]